MTFYYAHTLVSVGGCSSECEQRGTSQEEDRGARNWEGRGVLVRAHPRTSTTPDKIENQDSVVSGHPAEAEAKDRRINNNNGQRRERCTLFRPRRLS